MKVLTISDIAVRFVYSPAIRRRFSDVDLVIACGDLPYSYQEYIISSLDVPLYFVRGNHDKLVEYTVGGTRSYPHGGIDLHRRVLVYQGVILAGVEGCLRYRPGPYQYSSGEMWMHVFSLVPQLLFQRMISGRFLDVFVTHAPPQGIHDLDDLPHWGIPAFRWFIRVFQPSYHFHGHVHVYRPDTVICTQEGNTQVINTYGFRETDLEGLPDKSRRRWQRAKE